MTETFNEVIHSVKGRKLFGANARVEVTGDPYDDDLEEPGMKIRIISAMYENTFYCRVRALDCCGVLEVMYPRSESKPAFYLAMDAVVRECVARAKEGDWGNQLLATTSSESCRCWPMYLKDRGWKRFPAAQNPRTGRLVTIWRLKV